MAKKFVGFKPETLQKKVLPALGYNGPMDNKSINLFLSSNPAAAARMGKFTLAARRTIEGSPIKMMAEGGDTTEEEETTTDEGTIVNSGASTMTSAITTDPRKLTIKADTVANTGTGTDIATGTGQLPDANTATNVTAEQAPEAVASPTTCLLYTSDAADE